MLTRPRAGGPRPRAEAAPGPAPGPRANPVPDPQANPVPDPQADPGPEPKREAEPEDRWVGAHVFTGHPLDLVVRALVPEAVAELRQRGLADRYFLLRHWQGGPHLRLRVRLTAPAHEPAVRAALDAHAAAFFRALPPSRAMTAHQYRSLAQRLAAHEPESEPGALAPNDSLAFHPYRPEHAKYGHGAALRAAEDAFATCSALAVAAVLDGWSPARRAAHCFALLTGTMDTGDTGDTMDTGTAPVRPAPDVLDRYAERRAALLTVARAARAAAPAEAAEASAPAGAAGAAGRAGTDPMSQWLAACRTAQRSAASPARLAGHLTHLACNRLDVRLGQEAALRALARLAVAELTGDDPPGEHGARGTRGARGHGGDHDRARPDPGPDPGPGSTAPPPHPREAPRPRTGTAQAAD